MYGHSLAVAALLVGVGALLQFRSSLRAALGRFAALVGFGLLVGTVWTALETFRVLFDGLPPEVDHRGSVGAGTWLLAAAGVVVLVGAVLAHDWPARVPRPTGVSVHQVQDDDTPPLGIAIPVDGSDPTTPVGRPLDASDHDRPAALPTPSTTSTPEPPGDYGRHPTG